MRLRMVLAEFASPNEAFRFLGGRCARLRRRVIAALPEWMAAKRLPIQASIRL
jgi:hypothetical protein